MKKKLLCRLGQIMGGISIASILATSITAKAEGVTGILVDRVEHSDEMFEDYNYYRMQESDFDAIVEPLADLTQDEANADQVMDIINEMEDYFCEMEGMYAIANIYTTLEADNDDYDEELKYYESVATSVSDKIMRNYQLVALSPCSEELKEKIDDDDDWQDILDYVPMTQEQKDWSAEETELSLEYDELYNEEYTAVINGTTYNEDDLEEAYSDGTIDFTQYCNGLSDIMSSRNEALGNLYLELLDVRVKIADSYGYDNYADYAYEKLYDRDYSPEDLEEYRNQVKEYMVPLEDEIYTLLFDDYGDEYSEMWDVEVSKEDCLKALENYLPEISEDMMVSYHYMVDHNLYNIDVDDAKAPGGYTTSITVYNAPYMFNCSDGTYSDMNTVIHEFGHYNQMYYGSEDMWRYDSSDLDLAEINSQGLEVLYMDFSDELYGDYAEVMDCYEAFNQVYSTIEGCKEDAFQYAVYSDPEGMTLDKLNQLYYDACVEYGDEDLYNSYYLGLYGICDDDCIYEWVEVPHTFQSPLYYISYSVSMAAVEELRDIIMQDREKGIELYLELAEAGPDDSFQTTLESLGINNPITNPRFETYAENVRTALGITGTDSDSEIEDQEESNSDTEDADEDTGNSHSSRHSSQDNSKSDNAKDDDEKEDNSLFHMDEQQILILALAIVLGILVIAAIIIIIVLANRSNKNKENDVLRTQPPVMPNQNMGMNQQTMMPNQNMGMNQQAMMPNQNMGMNQQAMMPGQNMGMNQQTMMPNQNMGMNQQTVMQDWNAGESQTTVTPEQKKES